MLLRNDVEMNGGGHYVIIIMLYLENADSYNIYKTQYRHCDCTCLGCSCVLILILFSFGLNFKVGDLILYKYLRL